MLTFADPWIQGDHKSVRANAIVSALVPPKAHLSDGSSSC